jgi:LytS/YehU family sensor histidine kinase
MIISDWYSDNSGGNNESLKITVRFLSNEVRSDSIKIIVHKKICKSISSCSTTVLENSTISQELTSAIIRKAALMDKKSKEKNNLIHGTCKFSSY